MMAWIMSAWLLLSPCPIREWPWIDPPMVEEFVGIKRRTKNSRKQKQRNKKKAKRK